MGGIIRAFYSKIGITDLKFKPAYNPYTEPSLEIFGYHPGLKKLVEIGNSGVFRPEMLRPMGLPEDVNVIAWGLSLERPTMIHYELSNIRDLFGHKVPLSSTKNNKICYIVPGDSEANADADEGDSAQKKEEVAVEKVDNIEDLGDAMGDFADMLGDY